MTSLIEWVVLHHLHCRGTISTSLHASSVYSVEDRVKLVTISVDPQHTHVRSSGPCISRPSSTFCMRSSSDKANASSAAFASLEVKAESCARITRAMCS